MERNEWIPSAIIAYPLKQWKSNKTNEATVRRHVKRLYLVFSFLMKNGCSERRGTANN